LTGGALFGCASNQADSTEPRSSAFATQDLRIERGDFTRTVLLTGELEAVTGYPVLVPRLETWRVPLRWMLDDGSSVETGDRVIELDTTQVIGDVAQKRIAADTALSELYQKEADIAVQLADKQFTVDTHTVAYEKARLKAAVPEALTDRRTYQEDQLAAERAKVALDNAVADLEAFREASEREIEILRINLEKSRRDIARAERALETMVLRAPRDGIFVVGEHPWEGRKLQVGDSVWIGLKVGEVPDLSNMMVRAKLSDVDDGKITPGMRVTCTVDAYPDMAIGGTIREIGPLAQEERGSGMRRHFKVYVDLDRSDPAIMRPGMSVRVEVDAARSSDVLFVPRTAVTPDLERPLVHLAGGGEVEVELGPCNASVCVLLDGLEEGARVRTRG
jgi:multidrug resistance efflux pump